MARPGPMPSPAARPSPAVLNVTGGYEVAEVFAQGVVITAMRSHAWRDRDFEVHFDGIPDSTDFSFRPEPLAPGDGRHITGPRHQHHRE